MSTPIAVAPHAIPRTRFAHFSPTSRNEVRVPKSQGSFPSKSRTVRRAISRNVSAFRRRNAAGAISAPISPSVRRAISLGERARPNSRSAAGPLTSSDVRIEITQAHSCSKAEP